MSTSSPSMPQTHLLCPKWTLDASVPLQSWSLADVTFHKLPQFIVLASVVTTVSVCWFLLLFSIRIPSTLSHFDRLPLLVLLSLKKTLAGHILRTPHYVVCDGRKKLLRLFVLRFSDARCGRETISLTTSGDLSCSFSKFEQELRVRAAKHCPTEEMRRNEMWGHCQMIWEAVSGAPQLGHLGEGKCRGINCV